MIKNQNKNQNYLYEKNFSVYIHTSPNGKRYIGITSQKPIRRWKNGNGYKEHSPYFYSAIKKYGWDNFKHEIVYSGLIKEEAEAREVELISLYKSNCREFGYNIQNGGNSLGRHSEETKLKIANKLKGHFVSQETKQKISLLNKGRYFKLTDEQKEKIRIANIGKKLSSITKNKISIGNKGKTRSLTIRLKMSDYLKGIPKPTLHKHITKLNKIGEYLDSYESITIASKFTGVPVSNISAVINKKRKSAGGFLWKVG